MSICGERENGGWGHSASPRSGSNVSPTQGTLEEAAPATRFSLTPWVGWAAVGWDLEHGSRGELSWGTAACTKGSSQPFLSLFLCCPWECGPWPPALPSSLLPVGLMRTCTLGAKLRIHPSLQPPISLLTHLLTQIKTSVPVILILSNCISTQSQPANPQLWTQSYKLRGTAGENFTTHRPTLEPQAH